MSVQTLDQYSGNFSEGPHTILLYLNEMSNYLFINMLLFSLFMFLTISSYLISKRNNGFGNIMGSLLVSSLITTFSAVILSNIDGLVPTYTIGVLVSISVLFFLMLLGSRD